MARRQSSLSSACSVSDGPAALSDVTEAGALPHGRVFYDPATRRAASPAFEAVRAVFERGAAVPAAGFDEARPPLRAGGQAEAVFWDDGATYLSSGDEEELAARVRVVGPADEVEAPRTPAERIASGDMSVLSDEDRPPSLVAGARPPPAGGAARPVDRVVPARAARPPRSASSARGWELGSGGASVRRFQSLDVGREGLGLGVGGGCGGYDVVCMDEGEGEGDFVSRTLSQISLRLGRGKAGAGMGRATSMESVHAGGGAGDGRAMRKSGGSRLSRIFGRKRR